MLVEILGWANHRLTIKSDNFLPLNLCWVLGDETYVNTDLFEEQATVPVQ